MAEKQTIVVLNKCINAHSRSFLSYLEQSLRKELVIIPDYDTIFDKQFKTPSLKEVNEVVLKFDPILVVFFYGKNCSGNNSIMPYLNACRELRIPYLAINGSLPLEVPIKNILVPVGFLEEEREKAPLSNSFAMLFDAEVTLLEPRDRGTRAKTNIVFIQKLFQLYKRPIKHLTGKRNSFKIEKEGLAYCTAGNFQLLIITASRAYGLDDNFFGPKEYHILRKATVPVVILNPRDDLYVLCGN